MPLTKADVLNFGKTLSTTLDTLGNTMVKRSDEIDRDSLLNKYKNPDAIMKDINGNAKDPALIAAEVGNDMLFLSKRGFDKEAALLGDLYKTQIGFTSNEHRNKALLEQMRMINPDMFKRGLGTYDNDGNEKTIDEYGDFLSGKKFDLRYADLTHMANSSLAYTKEAAKPEKYIKIDRGDKIALVYPNMLDRDGRPIEVEYAKGEPPIKTTRVISEGTRESTSQSSSKNTTSQLRWVKNPENDREEIEMIMVFDADGNPISDKPTGQKRRFKR